MDFKRPTLTPNQHRFYAVLREYIAKWGISPTIPELKKLIGVSSLRSVTQYLEALERKGYINRAKHQKRSIRIAGGTGPTVIQLPVISAAGCDNASVIADQIYDEYIDVNKNILGRVSPQNTVVIRAVGKSMVDAGIEDGDYVITEVTQQAHDNDLVVAVVNGMAVIKKITFANNAVILNPVTSDKSYRPIIAKSDFQIFGKVIDSIKHPRNNELIYEDLPQ
jgi:repressor LexA